MELLNNLELIDVQYNNDNKKATLVFLDEERGEIREVNFNKQSFDNGKYIDDPEKAKKVEEWAKELFGLTFDTLAQAIGEKKMCMLMTISTAYSKYLKLLNLMTIWWVKYLK